MMKTSDFMEQVSTRGFEAAENLYLRTLHAADIVRAVVMRVRGIAQQHVIVVGSPRSGTSWVMRLIAHRPEYCTMFEPLHPRWWSGVREAGFDDRPMDGDEKKRDYIRQLLRGTKACREPRWSPSIERNPIRLIRGTVHRLSANRLVIKFVRACRLLPWLVREFPDQRYVYVRRDPYAVVNSQLRRGVSAYVDDRGMPYDLLNADEQPQSSVDLLCQRIRADAEKILDPKTVQGIDSLEGCLALSWYADNLIAKRAADTHDSILIVHYEKLLTNTEEELERIRDHAGATGPLAGHVHVKNPHSQINKWQSQLSADQVERIRRVLGVLTREYGDLDSQPTGENMRGTLGG